jgi:2-iminobutanoate/2-iminopropanoate deaminase
MKQAIFSAEGHAPIGAYSQAIRSGEFIFVAGQPPVDPATGEVVGDTIEEQTHRALQNVRNVLAEAGATMADVVNAMVYLSSMELWDRYNAVFGEYFPDPKPARCTIGCELTDIMIEIVVIARVGGSVNGA